MVWPHAGTTLVAACASRYTGKERDVESGNDYFGARYYGSTMGRFMSPDWASNPVPVPFAKIENPQTLNLYAYVQNNPLSFRDKDGHDDYTYDQSGNQTDLKNAASAQGMTLDQFKEASKNNAPFDFKRQLSGTSLYMWSDGKAYDSDGIGNITWGYLSSVAVGGSIDRATAHLGAAYAQVFIDRTSKPEWMFRHTLGDRPQDYDAINAGRDWQGGDAQRARGVRCRLQRPSETVR